MAGLRATFARTQSPQGREFSSFLVWGGGRGERGAGAGAEGRGGKGGPVSTPIPSFMISMNTIVVGIILLTFIAKTIHV